MLLSMLVTVSGQIAGATGATAAARTNVHAYTYAHTHMYKHVHAYTHANTHMYNHIHCNMHKHVHAYTHAHTHMHQCVKHNVQTPTTRPSYVLKLLTKAFSISSLGRTAKALATMPIQTLYARTWTHHDDL